MKFVEEFKLKLHEKRRKKEWDVHVAAAYSGSGNGEWRVQNEWITQHCSASSWEDIMCFHSCYLCEAIIFQIMSASHATQLTAFRMRPNKIEKRASADRVVKRMENFLFHFGFVLFHFPLHFHINQTKRWKKKELAHKFTKWCAISRETTWKAQTKPKTKLFGKQS